MLDMGELVPLPRRKMSLEVPEDSKGGQTCVCWEGTAAGNLNDRPSMLVLFCPTHGCALPGPGSVQTPLLTGLCTWSSFGKAREKPELERSPGAAP